MPHSDNKAFHGHVYPPTLWRAGDKINIWHHYSAATGNVAKYCGRTDGGRGRRGMCVRRAAVRSSGDEDECEKLEPSAMRFIPPARSSSFAWMIAAPPAAVIIHFR